MPISLPSNMQPPPRRKSVKSMKRLLLNPRQVEVAKKKSSVRILVDIGCTRLCKAAFPEFLCPLCYIGDQEKVIKVLKSCATGLRVLSTSTRAN